MFIILRNYSLNGSLVQPEKWSRYASLYTNIPNPFEVLAKWHTELSKLVKHSSNRVF